LRGNSVVDVIFTANSMYNQSVSKKSNSKEDEIFTSNSLNIIFEKRSYLQRQANGMPIIFSSYRRGFVIRRFINNTLQTAQNETMGLKMQGKICITVNKLTAVGRPFNSVTLSE